MELPDVIARQDIQRVINAYAVCFDYMIWDRMETLWADDAVLIPPGGTRIEGRAAIMSRLRRMEIRDLIAAGAAAAGRAPLTFMRHHVTTCDITIDDATTAHGTTYFAVITDAGLDQAGVYRDEFRRIDGRWLFSVRRARVDLITPDAYFGVTRAAVAADLAREGLDR